MRRDLCDVAGLWGCLPNEIGRFHVKWTEKDACLLLERCIVV